MGKLDPTRVRRTRELRVIVSIVVVAAIAMLVIANFYVRINAQVQRDAESRERASFDTETFLVWEEHVRAARSYVEFGAGERTSIAPFIVGGHVLSINGEYGVCERRRLDDLWVRAAVRRGKLDHVCINLVPTSDARMDIDWLEAGLAYTRAAKTAREARGITRHDFVYVSGPFSVACVLSLILDDAIDTSSVIMLYAPPVVPHDIWQQFFDEIEGVRANAVTLRPRAIIDREQLSNLLAFFLRNP